jgi:hypothetical protein
MINGIKESTDIGIEYPSHLTSRNTHPHGVQRIVLVPTWAEPVTETEKCLFVDLIEYLHDCLLDYFVLQGRYTDGPFTPVRLWYPDPLRGHCPVSAALYTFVESR